jgi:regulator of RNase E activity RraA
MGECRIFRPGPDLDPSLAARFAAVAASVVSDSQERSGSLRGLVPITTPCRFVGAATTVRTREGDNLAVHHALDISAPGRVIVVDAGGYEDRAILGEIMASYARHRGLVALVVDGAVRDREGLQGVIPTFARSVTHLGPFKDGPGEVHGAISVGGQVVNDGDVILGDEDGVVVVAYRDAPRIIEAAEARASDEARKLQEIAEGRPDRRWVKEAVRALGPAV